MEKKKYKWLLLLVIVLVVIFGLKLTSNIKFTNVIEPDLMEEEVEVINNKVEYKDINKKDTNEAIVSIKQGEIKEKKNKDNNKERKYSINNTIIKKVKDEYSHK